MKKKNKTRPKHKAVEVNNNKNLNWACQKGEDHKEDTVWGRAPSTWLEAQLTDCTLGQTVEDERTIHIQPRSTGVRSWEGCRMHPRSRCHSIRTSAGPSLGGRLGVEPAPAAKRQLPAPSHTSLPPHTHLPGVYCSNCTGHTRCTSLASGGFRPSPHLGFSPDP